MDTLISADTSEGVYLTRSALICGQALRAGHLRHLRENSHGRHAQSI